VTASIPLAWNTPVRVPDIDAECGLPVRPGGNHPIGPVLGEDRLEHTPGGGWCHVCAVGERCGDDNVVGEQCHQGSNVPGLVGRHQVFNDGSFGLGMRGGCGVS
jgi:hypothetical protein